MKNNLLGIQRIIFVKKFIAFANPLLLFVLPIVFVFNRQGLTLNNLERPMTYSGDGLQLAALVSNAQQGHWWRSETLGGAMGQQLHLTPYGAEWPASTFASILSNSHLGPWNAITNYYLLSFGLVALTSYFALRLLKIPRGLAFILGLLTTFMPGHQFEINWVYLSNYAAIPIAVAITILLASGLRFFDLIPFSRIKTNQEKTAFYCVAGILFAALSASGANYYIWFNALLPIFVALLFAARRNFWERSRRLILFGFYNLFINFLILSPIILSKISSGMTIFDDSTSDRRAFAAIANGGEPLSAILPSRTSVSMKVLNEFGLFQNFFNEYNSSLWVPMAGYVGGLVVVVTLLLITAVQLGLFDRKTRFKSANNVGELYYASLAVLLISFLIFSRGGLGLGFAFIFPGLRVYARSILLVSFSCIAIFGLIFALVRQKKKASFVYLLISLVLLADSTSGIFQIGVVPDKNSLQATSSASFVAQAPESTKKQLLFAEGNYEKNCTLLVLPPVTFPVDFSVGFDSYNTYETLKLGIEPSRLHWTSGSIMGTPNSESIAEVRNLYLRKEYNTIFSSQSSFCGIAFYRSLQDAMSASTAGRSENYDSSSQIESSLIENFWKKCYEESDASFEFYCRK